MPRIAADQAEANLDELSYADFVRAHGLGPLVDIKTALHVTNLGHTRFYEQVKKGVFVLIPNGSRRNVTALNLYQHHCAIVAAARAETE
jgi:hypothetical protein